MDLIGKLILIDDVKEISASFKKEMLQLKRMNNIRKKY